MHIAVVAASAPSHMHPHLAAVRELVERGHRVSYLVASHLADLARTTGADVVGCTSVLPGAPGAPPEWSGDDVAGMRLFLDEAIHVLPQVHAALDGDRPDIVLYDIGGMAGSVAAERWGVPAVQVSPSMVAWTRITRTWPRCWGRCSTAWAIRHTERPSTTGWRGRTHR